jgi:hypothetical protein
MSALCLHIQHTTLKVVLALVAILNLECDAANVVTAFLNG